MVPHSTCYQLAKQCRRKMPEELGSLSSLTKGAIKMRTTPELEKAISAIINKAEALDLVDGVAQLVDSVYMQEFGTQAGATNTTAEGDNAWAVRSMYASRVHFDTESQVTNASVCWSYTDRAIRGCQAWKHSWFT